MHSRMQRIEQTVPYRFVASIYHSRHGASLAMLRARLNRRNFTRLFFFRGRVLFRNIEGWSRTRNSIFIFFQPDVDLPRRNTSIGRCSFRSLHVISAELSLVRLPSVSNTFLYRSSSSTLPYPLFGDHAYDERLFHELRAKCFFAVCCGFYVAFIPRSLATN